MDCSFEAAMDIEHRQPVQALDTSPTDRDLARILYPEGRSMGVRIEESAREIRGVPKTIPMWFAAVCVTLPVCVMFWFFIRDFRDSGLDLFRVGGAITAMLAVPTFLGIIYAMNRWMQSKGDYFVADTFSQTLHLPRTAASFRRDQLEAFVEVHGWIDLNRSMAWSCELSVLARNDDGGLERHPVAIDDRTSRISRIADQLCNFYDVPKRVVKLNRQTRKELGFESWTR